MAAQELCNELSKALGEIVYSKQGIVGPALARLERTTGIKRDHFVHGFISILLAYLVLGREAEFVCNLIGFLYPAYCSIQLIQLSRNDHVTRWLSYWMIFAFFSVLEIASEHMVGWFPLYWLSKCLFILWLYLPMTRGSGIVYERLMFPFIEKFTTRLAEMRQAIDKQIREAKEPDECIPDEGPTDISPPEDAEDNHQRENGSVQEPTDVEKSSMDPQLPPEAIPRNNELINSTPSQDNVLSHSGDGDLLAPKFALGLIERP